LTAPPGKKYMGVPQITMGTIASPYSGTVSFNDSPVTSTVGGIY